eukprot:CAMPEP_0170197506 /NCGR_PEP_ID=MMETSP0040_2-20121228/66576_1 /TAXON_ID=641309 /ORGANISM="Lotharella oceanica, Strain CCMP622" /LENGTH=265 /DNA_ID=CAMNT_0010447195 /DNA_START=11 /DNA_END=808 /DNA_ORIENTATION=-
MIATVSPGVASVEHTLNTLRYADRVKEMKEAGSSNRARHNAYMPHNDDGQNRTRKSISPKPPKKLLPQRTQSMMSFPSGLKAPSYSTGTYTSRTPPYKPSTAKTPSTMHLKKGSGGKGSGSKKHRGSRLTKIPSRVTPQMSRAASSPPSRSPTKDDVSKSEAVGMQELLERHKELVDENVQAEAALLDQHKKHIHSTMLMVKQEMELLKKMESKQFPLNQYIDQLKDILGEKVQGSTSLAARLQLCQENLRKAEYVGLQLEQLNL